MSFYIISVRTIHHAIFQIFWCIGIILCFWIADYIVIHSTTIFKVPKHYYLASAKILPVSNYAKWNTNIPAEYGKKERLHFYWARMIKSLQQPQFATLFVKSMGRMPWTIVPAAYWFREFHDENGSFKDQSSSGRPSVVLSQASGHSHGKFSSSNSRKNSENVLNTQKNNRKTDVCACFHHQARSVNTTPAYSKATRRQNQHLFL